MTLWFHRFLSTILKWKHVCRIFIFLLLVISLLLLLSLNMQHMNMNISAGEDTMASMEKHEMVTVHNVGSGENRPWYMHGGTRRPIPAARNNETGSHNAKIWPHTEDTWTDRITNQLMFVPPAYTHNQKIKKIVFYEKLPSWYKVKLGRDTFKQEKCPVDTCAISVDRLEAADADAIIFWDRFEKPGHTRPPRQIWILLFMECPYHTWNGEYEDFINWTATYRHDSDIVYPYGRWEYYNESIKQNTQLNENYAANKTRKVAWFVSNCWAKNGRLEYAYELQKHISVDIFGECGTKKCPRSSESECWNLLEKNYKFYLAFENSNCKDYITEKLFVNGLQHNILPIVMGARPEDYSRVAPYRSYIHVDKFESPAELASYLHHLDIDDNLYNSYFRWKGTGEFINTHFLCRLCAMLHDDFPNKHYHDVKDWWRGPGVCTNRSWRETK